MKKFEYLNCLILKTKYTSLNPSQMGGALEHPPPLPSSS